MPIKIPQGLPAWNILVAEGVPLITTQCAIHQDIRPLKIALLNLMPDKSVTETQFARLLGASPLQIELTLLALESHTPKHTQSSYMEQFYCSWNDLRVRNFDALIITGAPIEHLPFAEVSYWQELKEILLWSLTHVTRTFTVCWGAQAALYALYGVPKLLRQEKIFGLYRHRTTHPAHPLLLGVNDEFNIPVSRFAYTEGADIERISRLSVLIQSDELGPCMIEDQELGYVFMLNHLEYDTDTLHREFIRDQQRDPQRTVFPKDYYLKSAQQQQLPGNTWRATAHLIFRNLIGVVYAQTPYQLCEISALRPDIPPEILSQLKAG